VTDRREPELPFDEDPYPPQEPGPATSTEPTGGPKDQPVAAPEPDPDADENQDEPLGLLDHLAELRGVLIHSAVAALLATILCWFWSADLLDILIRPIKDQGIYFTAPNEAFLTRLKLSAVVGLFVVAPFIFFKIYGFILPGLYKRERRVVTPLLIATTALFYTGVAFAFLVVIPQVMSFLLSFGTEVMEPLIGVGPYFNFVSRLCLAFGLVFELPLLVLFLSYIGLLNPRTLLRAWRFAIIIIVSMSAVLTPPDVISQIMMAGPVIVLYLGSVLVAIAVTSRRQNKNKDRD
jgi:sec-independent protein translocase protein TatC